MSFSKLNSPFLARIVLTADIVNAFPVHKDWPDDKALTKSRFRLKSLWLTRGNQESLLNSFLAFTQTFYNKIDK